jgi:cytochrome b
MTTTTVKAEPAAGDVRVWDPFVRFFHWSLAAAFFVAYFTEDEVMALHVWAGYAVGGLVLLRVLWGFVGTRHARFSDFLFGPFAALQYLRDLALFRAPRHIGHSPAGAFMVFLLLGACLLIVATGLLAYGAEGHGPLKGYVEAVEPSPTIAVVSQARADTNERVRSGDSRKSRAGELYEDLHEVLANVGMTLVLLHIAGVLLASLVHRENLTRAMVTGRKRAE